MALLNFLVTLAVLHLTNALFYTTSKENDLPRMGKRQHFHLFDELGRFRKQLSKTGQEADDLLEETERTQDRRRITEDIEWPLYWNRNSKVNWAE